MPASSHLDERLTGGQERGDARPHWKHDAAQLGVAHIPARDPHDLRRWAVLLEQAPEVVVLGDHDRRTTVARRGEDHRVVRAQIPDVVHMRRVHTILLGQPPRERRRQLGVDPDARASARIGAASKRHLRREPRVVEAPRGVQQGRGDVFALEIRVVPQDLRLGRPGRQQAEHVGNANAHATDTRTAAALLGAKRDAREEFDVGHGASGAVDVPGK